MTNTNTNPMPAEQKSCNCPCCPPETPECPCGDECNCETGSCDC